MADTATIEKPAEQAAEPFDSAAFIARRNAQAAGKEPPAPAEPKPATPAKPAVQASPAATGEDAGDHDEDDEPSSSAAVKPGAPDKAPQTGNRAMRRELNRLNQELGFERGQKAMLQQLIDSGMTRREAAAQVEDANPEPKREQFATDADYTKAIAQFEGRKIAEELRQEAVVDEETRQLAIAAKAKYETDIKAFPDWEEMKVKMAAIPLVSNDHPDLVSAVLTSDNRAKVLYHWAKEPASLQRLLTLKGTAQLREFTKLEGRLDLMYNQPTATGAGSEPPNKERPPEKPAKGAQTAAERDLSKPRPTAEVVAPGGSAAPSEPEIGSAAWMQRKNAERNGR